MSRLSDLLNPVPPSRDSPALQPINTSQPTLPLPSLASPLCGLALDGAMAEIAVKREPSDTASPVPNGATPHKDAGSIAETIETAVKYESPADAKPDGAASVASPSEQSGDKQGSLNGVKKKAPPKKKSAIARPKNTGSKSSKKAASRIGKTDSESAKQPATAQAGDESLEDEDEDEEGGVFCTCRGPDDHTWMIGCDGDCEDWFHGRCVNIAQSDADLIEQYICPNCFIKGKRQTTWKPMCRLEGCRRPARVNEPDPSKYCSDAHGEEYFRRRVMQKTRRADGQPPTKKRQLEKPDKESDPTHLHGGLLSRSEVKTLSDSTASQVEFSRLGDAIRPADESSEVLAEDKGPTVTDVSDHTCTPEERDHLKQVLDASARARHSLNVLADKEKFLKKARSQAALKNAGSGGAAADLKKKETFREVCGFDSRLAWNEDEFDAWRTSEQGRKVLLESEVLLPPAAATSTTDGDGDSEMQDTPAEDTEERRETICQRKRCDQHKTWWKIHHQNITHERSECYQRLEKLGDEARGIQERAMLKQREEQGRSAVQGAA